MPAPDHPPKVSSGPRSPARSDHPLGNLMRPPQANFLPEHSTLGQSPIFSTFSPPLWAAAPQPPPKAGSLPPAGVAFTGDGDGVTQRYRKGERGREGQGKEGGREKRDGGREGDREGGTVALTPVTITGEVSTLPLGDHTQVLASVTQAPVTLRRLPPAQPLPLIGGCCNPLTHPLKRRPGSPQEAPTPLKPLTHDVGHDHPLWP